jgi:hypothetical protein
MFALSIALNLAFQHLVFLNANLQLSEKIPSVAILSVLISPMRMTGSTTLGQRAIASLSLLKLLNF